MKAILMSIQPKWVAKILNKEKLLEIRKRFPKDYRGWVYIYATKDKRNYLFDFRYDEEAPDKFGAGKANKWFIKNNPPLNGKVVARFWCDNVDRIWKTTTDIWTYGSDLEPNFYKESCLNDIELNKYLKPTKVGFNYQYGYAIHISQLEIFDRPRELSEFRQYTGFDYNCSQVCSGYRKYEARCLEPEKCCPYLGKKITKAPRSYTYIEEEK